MTLLASFIGCPIFEKQEKAKMKNGEKRNAIIAALSKPTKDGFWEGEG